MATGRLLSILLRAARTLAAGLALGVLGCNGTFYLPSHRLLGWPVQPFERVRIPTEDGLVLEGWLLHPAGPLRGTVVQFHGNADNMSGHFRHLEWVTEHGLALLTFDYRGYGHSPGEASPDGLIRDGRAAIHFANTLPHGTWRRDLVLWGQSLGGAVLLTSYAKSGERERVRAVIAESTFHSYSEVAASVLWRSGLLLPLTGFAYAWVSDAESPARYLAEISPTPLLVVHGLGDVIVPAEFGRAVYALARPPRELWLVRGAGHLEVFEEPRLRSSLLRYLERLEAQNALPLAVRSDACRPAPCRSSGP